MHLLLRYGYEGILNHVYSKSRQHWKVHVDVSKWSEYLCTTELRQKQQTGRYAHAQFYYPSHYSLRLKIFLVLVHCCGAGVGGAEIVLGSGALTEFIFLINIGFTKVRMEAPVFIKTHFYYY